MGCFLFLLLVSVVFWDCEWIYFFHEVVIVMPENLGINTNQNIAEAVSDKVPDICKIDSITFYLFPINSKYSAK